MNQWEDAMIYTSIQNVACRGTFFFSLTALMSVLSLGCEYPTKPAAARAPEISLERASISRVPLTKVPEWLGRELNEETQLSTLNAKTSSIKCDKDWKLFNVFGMLNWPETHMNTDVYLYTYNEKLAIISLDFQPGWCDAFIEKIESCDEELEKIKSAAHHKSFNLLREHVSECNTLDSFGHVVGYRCTKFALSLITSNVHHRFADELKYYNGTRILRWPRKEKEIEIIPRNINILPSQDKQGNYIRTVAPHRHRILIYENEESLLMFLRNAKADLEKESLSNTYSGHGQGFRGCLHGF